jgi:hypothetical protein
VSNIGFFIQSKPPLLHTIENPTKMCDAMILGIARVNNQST